MNQTNQSNQTYQTNQSNQTHQIDEKDETIDKWGLKIYTKGEIKKQEKSYGQENYRRRSFS